MNIGELWAGRLACKESNLTGLAYDVHIAALFPRDGQGYGARSTTHQGELLSVGGGIYLRALIGSPTTGVVRSGDKNEIFLTSLLSPRLENPCLITGVSLQKNTRQVNAGSNGDTVF